MLLLKLIKETDAVVVYNYFPEQKEDFGTVTLDKKTGKITDIQISSNDMHKRYMYHAVSKICQFFESGMYKQEEIVAWY